MDKKAFLEILYNYRNMSPGDARELEELIKKFPYCSTFYSLLAKASMLQNSPDVQQKLSTAAIYAPNRSILKKIVENELFFEIPDTASIPENSGVAVDEEVRQLIAEVDNLVEEEKHLNEITDKLESESFKETEETVYSETVSKNATGFVSSESMDEILKEIEENMKSLKERMSKVNFDNLEEPASKKFSEEVVIVDEETENINPSDPEPASQEPPPLPEPLIMKEENVPYVLDTKNSDIPVDLRQKEQWELIDRFIEEVPKMRGSLDKLPQTEQTDLSDRSAEITDDLISENLAVIMIKQGKIDKAVDIYKKLIWKFPQKKAYFASRIEELNKK